MPIFPLSNLSTLLVERAGLFSHFGCLHLTPALGPRLNWHSPNSSWEMATGRKRSGTLSSQLLAQAQAQNQTFAGYPAGPITLQAQVHSNGANSYPNVLLNRERVPYFQAGDIIELRCVSTSTSGSSNVNFNSNSSSKQPCIFMIDVNDPVNLPPTMQISLSKDIASCFGISSGMEVTISKVSKAGAQAILFHLSYFT